MATSYLEGLEHQTRLVLNQHGPGCVHVARCEICGFLWWTSTTPHKPDEVVYTDSPSGCDRCHTVVERSPEVFRWAVGIMCRTRMMLEEMQTQIQATKGLISMTLSPDVMDALAKLAEKNNTTVAAVLRQAFGIEDKKDGN